MASQQTKKLEWSDLDERTVNLIRVLAMDAVENEGSGHPGTAMSLAPAAYLLFQRIMRHDPMDPAWTGRDRFVLSCGHSSLTLYIQLYLSGYGLTLDDLKAYRSWGSLTPGHPEHGLTPGVETTTGPLGQGLGNAVGMAMAARRERGLFDPDAAEGQSPFDHYVYVFASDGDIEEGITHEASALAGDQELGNLIVLYDDNHISIEDDTDIAKAEDIAARYEAYGWHVQRLDWDTPKGYHEDVQALYDAFEAAKAETSRPSFISLRTIIGWPAPNKQGTGAAHGSALGADEVAATKKILGFDPEVSFPLEAATWSTTPAGCSTAAARPTPSGTKGFKAWAGAQRRAEGAVRPAGQPDPAGRLGRGAARTFKPDPKGVATRKASGEVLSALGQAAARAVGRLGRPGRQQPHHDEGRAVLPAARPPDQDVPRQQVRPHAALRHPRARHGRDPQRHRPARRNTAVRRHVPGRSATTCGARCGWPR